MSGRRLEGGDSLLSGGEVGKGIHLCCGTEAREHLLFGGNWAFLVVQMVKNLPSVWEAWVQSLGWEDPLEEGMATQSSIWAWRIPLDRGAWWAMVYRVAKSWTQLSDFHFFF